MMMIMIKSPNISLFIDPEVFDVKIIFFHHFEKQNGHYLLMREFCF